MGLGRLAIGSERRLTYAQVRYEDYLARFFRALLALTRARAIPTLANSVHSERRLVMPEVVGIESYTRPPASATQFLLTPTQKETQRAISKSAVEWESSHSINKEGASPMANRCLLYPA